MITRDEDVDTLVETIRAIRDDRSYEVYSNVPDPVA
jgi:hypothetical protein